MKEHTTDSQCSAILEHLKKGLSITPLEALNRFGCFRLSARIHDLRHKQGYDNIVTERAQYRLAI